MNWLLFLFICVVAYVVLVAFGLLLLSSILSRFEAKRRAEFQARVDRFRSHIN